MVTETPGELALRYGRIPLGPARRKDTPRPLEQQRHRILDKDDCPLLLLPPRLTGENASTTARRLAAGWRLVILFPDGRLIHLEPYGGATTRVTHEANVGDFRLYVR